MGCDDTMWTPNNLLKKWRWGWMRSIVREDDSFDPVAQGIGVGSEPLSCAESVTLKTIRQDREILAVKTILHCSQIFRRNFKTARFVHWQ